jgi:hypothetical protein
VKKLHEKRPQHLLLYVMIYHQVGYIAKLMVEKKFKYLYIGVLCLAEIDEEENFAEISANGF